MAAISDRKRVVVCFSILLCCHLCISDRYTPYNQMTAQCPVSTPCYCEYTGYHRLGRAKRIICGQLGSQFPVFMASDEIIDCVNLMYTGIVKLPPDAFAPLRVTRIDLQGNNFGGRINERAFAYVARHLAGLNLAWSNITSLPAKVFRGMLHLRNLSLAENKLTTVSHLLFQNLRSLEILSIAGNHIREFPATIFRYQTNLHSLDLGYGKLERVPNHLFTGLWNLRTLDLRGNMINHLSPGVFEDLWSLETLSLSHNPIHVIKAGVFRGLNSLERLEIKESSLGALESGIFADTVGLSILDLGDNRLTEIQDGVLRIPSLEWLALDGNGLKVLPRDVAMMSSLVYLDISYNNIKSLDRCIFERLRSLEYFNFRVNPFHCDCYIYWLRTLQVRLLHNWDNHRIVPFVSAECATPWERKEIDVARWVDPVCLRDGSHKYKCWYEYMKN